MDFHLCLETTVGDSVPLLSGTINPQAVAEFALKFADIRRFIPQLSLVINGHTLTEVVYERGNCKLRGNPVHWLHSIGEG